MDRKDWPAQSLDQNYIENVWRILKIKVKARKFANIFELGKVIK
jgi:transposase